MGDEQRIGDRVAGGDPQALEEGEVEQAQVARLVIVELGPERPAMAVGPRKRAKIRALAAAWLRERGYDVPRHRDLRFDVVGLRLDGRGKVTEYEHLRAAF